MTGFSNIAATVATYLILLQPLIISPLALALPRPNSPTTNPTPITDSATDIPEGNNAQPASVWPTKHYNLTLTRGWVDANGEGRDAILVNGQTPGPLIESEEGQELSILVINELGEPTTMHWHGIIQYGTVWADGVPGVTQYPIADGQNLTYTFTPVQYGQYWYHSHYHSQVSDGARGPMLIHPASTRPNPFSWISGDSADQKQMEEAERDPRIVMTADWSAFTAVEYDGIFRASGLQLLCTDSFLVNGRGQRICPNLDELAPFAPPIVQPLSAKGCLNVLSPIVTGGNFNASTQFPDAIPEGLYDGECKNTSTPLTVFQVDPEAGWASFNFIHTGGLLEEQISIDGHQMIIYAADGHYIEPQWVDVLLLSIGARYSAMVKLDNPGDWTIRTANPLPNQFIAGYSVLSYTSNARSTCGEPINGLPALCGNQVFTSPPSNQPKMGFAANLLDGAILHDQFTMKPYPPTAPPSTVDHTIIWDMAQEVERIWSIDHQALLPWREQDVPAIVDYQPLLDANVATWFDNGSVVDIVFNVPAGQPPHPFHKHENKAWVIGQGVGSFEWANTAEATKAVPDSFNLYDPSYRDTYRTLPALQNPSWQVIRYQVDHPSLTFFHCHISYHLSAGMAIVLVEGLDVGHPELPDAVLAAANSSTIVSANPNPVLPDGSIVEG